MYRFEYIKLILVYVIIIFTKTYDHCPFSEFYSNTCLHIMSIISQKRPTTRVFDSLCNVIMRLYT